MHRSRAAIAAVTVLTVTAATSASAQAPSPTIAFDRECYSPGDTMTFEGAGYTPNGAVEMLFTANGRIGSYSTLAASDGAIAGSLDSPLPDDFLDKPQAADDVFVTANDQTRIQEQAPPESQFGATQFRLSRWAIGYHSANGKIVANRRIRFQALGFTHAVGERLYVHYRLGARTVKSIRLGVLRGPCGDLNKKLSRGFPFRPVEPGTYKLIFNTSPSKAAEGPSIVFPRVRVRARDVR